MATPGPEPLGDSWPGRTIGPLAAAGLALATLLVVVAPCVAVRWHEAPPPSASPLVSLLVVGDTGDPPAWISARDGQLAVAEGMEHEDRRAPVHALVLLGDNFYERGLAKDTIARRVRGNLVTPYCRFVELAGPRSAEVSAACPDAGAERPPLPIYAVLGNHDWRTSESRQLEQQEVSQFVSNWKLAPLPATTVELGSGVSLVLFDSTPLETGGDPAPLREALKAARGPWRILAAHHPIGTSRDSGYKKSSGVGDYGERVQQAIREAGVDVQLMLAGHEHSLQIVRVDPPGPRVVVVSGAGSRPRQLKTKSRGRLFSHEGLGFARVDFTPTVDGDRLAISLFSTPRWRAFFGLAPELLGRWSVSRDGGLHALPLKERLRESP